MQNLTQAPTAPDSAAVVANLAQQVSSRYGGVAAFNNTQYDMAVYTATPQTPKTRVQWVNCQNKPSMPTQLYSGPAWFDGVPIPAGAVPAAGTDAEITVYEPASDQLWELWEAKQTATGWQACWGGRLDHARESPGYFADSGGALATGLVGAAGQVSLDEAAAGTINHALEVALPEVRSGVVSWPAQRSDGTSRDATAPAEGQRFRLDPTLDIASLHLTPMAAAIAVAAQRYGFVISDVAGAATVFGQNGVASPGGQQRWTTLLAGTPSYAVMKGFPWDRLQALPLSYGKPGS